LRDTGLAVRPIDFADLRSKDTLNSNPPKMFNQIVAAPRLFAPLIRTASEGTGPSPVGCHPVSSIAQESRLLTWQHGHTATRWAMPDPFE
jgi:hypothetical protein